MTKTLLAAVFSLAFVGTAYAGTCPVQLKAVDDALAKTTLSAADQTEVKKFRAEGNQFHKDGKHAEAIAAINKAKVLLKIQ